MILPIVAFGAPILREKCIEVTPDFPDLDILIENMWETMYAAHGVGLAAPQINKGIRLFLIDTSPFLEDEESEVEALKMVFINPVITSETGDEWRFNEGCLSIPEIREDISRKSLITIEYLDEKFEKHIQQYEGISARVIMHEYDHLNGVLFIDKLSPLRKRVLKGKLMDISKGKVDTAYKMRIVK
ncbi:peptide deformylase [Flavobacteriales bacterium]|nr:peptide deformylase [Flavobacteriales bacterium]